MEGRDRGKATIVMLICALGWSLGGICIKMISWNALVIIGFRSLIAGGFLLAYMKKEGLRFVFNKYSIIIGVALSSTMAMYVFANKMTTAANAIVIQYTCPVWVLLISAVFFRKKINRIDALVVVICVAGIALFFFDQITPGNMIGNIIALMSGIGLATVMVVNGVAKDSETQYSGIVIGQSLACLFGLIGGLAQGGFSPQPMEILFILVLGIVQMGMPYLLYPYAAKRLSPLACSLIGMLEPIANPIWVAVFYGEVPGMFAFAGGTVIIVTTSLWMIWQSRHPELQ